MKFLQVDLACLSRLLPPSLNRSDILRKPLKSVLEPIGKSLLDLAAIRQGRHAPLSPVTHTLETSSITAYTRLFHPRIHTRWWIIDRRSSLDDRRMRRLSWCHPVAVVAVVVPILPLMTVTQHSHLIPPSNTLTHWPKPPEEKSQNPATLHQASAISRSPEIFVCNS